MMGLCTNDIASICITYKDNGLKCGIYLRNIGHRPKELLTGLKASCLCSCYCEKLSHAYEFMAHLGCSYLLQHSRICKKKVFILFWQKSFQFHLMLCITGVQPRRAWFIQHLSPIGERAKSLKLTKHVGKV